MQLLDVRASVHTKDGKIITLTTERDKLRSNNLRLVAKLDELRMKYEPGTLAGGNCIA